MADGTIPPPTGVPASMPAGAPTTVPPAGAAVPTGDSGVNHLADGRTQILSTSTFKRIKEQARKKGRDEAMKELDKLAQGAGFKDAAAAFAAMSKGGRGNGNGGQGNGRRPQQQSNRQNGQGGGAPPTAPTPPKNRGDARAMERYQKAMERFDQDRAAYKERINRTAQRNRELQRQLDAKDAEISLREAAVACGVRDIDYAIRLLTRHLEGQDEAALQGFDERKFFEGLRAEKPYLFGEAVVAAHTGTAGAPPTGNGAPPVPPPGSTAAAAAQGAQVDARKMSREQFAARLAKMGLNPPG